MSENDRTTGLLGYSGAKIPVRVASTVNQAAITGLLTIDGVVLVADDRVLLTGQTDQTENGIYVADTGDWERAKDCDGSYDLVKGSLVYATNGTSNSGFWICSATNPVVVGTSNIPFTMASTVLAVITAFAQTLLDDTTAAQARTTLGVGDLVPVTGVAGTNTITGGIPTANSAYVTNGLYVVIPAGTNTGATTINLTPTGGAALGAKAALVNGAAMIGGEIVLAVPAAFIYDGTSFNLIGTGKFANSTQDLVPVKTADFLFTYDASAKLYKKVLLQDVPLQRMGISGLTYSNNAGDVTNDIDIAAGSCRDSTDAVNMFNTATLTKQLDTAWAVGSGQGGLDTGVVGNSEYYVHLIKRSDTGVVDALFSLSATAPTMPGAGVYDYRRLIGWVKRVAGVNVLFTLYETEGGGIEHLWSVPTLDINLANTLTTARRTDAVKVPLNFSVTAMLSIYCADAAAAFANWICCPDETDAAPSTSAAPLTNNSISTAGGSASSQLNIRTSAAGLIAARSTLATVDLYAVSTMGFRWARRN